MNYLIYDIESRKRVLSKEDIPRLGEIYASSWGDRTDQGISVLCTCNPATMECRVFFYEDLAEFSAYASRFDVLSGYNIKSYDDKMLEAHGYPVAGIPRYDLMQEIRQINPDGKKALKLDAVLPLNGFPAKQGSGADAPFLWQTKQLGKLVTYCLEDVRLEALLFNKALTQQPIWVSSVDHGILRHPSLAELKS